MHNQIIRFYRGVAGAVAGLALVFSSATAQAADFVVSNWDGYMPADMMEQVKKATGYSGEVSFHATNEEIMGKLTASKGAGYDVVFVSSPFAEILNNLGLLAPLTPAKVPNLKYLYPEARQLAYDPGNQFSAPYAWGTTGLCYRSDLVNEDIDSWKDLLQPSADLSGKITMLATERWLMAAGLLAKGYSVNDTDKAHINEVRDLLIDAKRKLLAYDDATFYSKLVSGEAVLTHAWDGWCNYGIAENANIKFVVPKEGSDLWVDTMVVMNKSKNKDAAYAFVNFVLDPKNHAWVAENILYKVPNKAAMEAVGGALAESFPNMGMTPGELMKMELMRDLGRGQKDYSRASTEIMSAQ
jgi:spermidine/putrescine transport system substrate-binding protein